MKKHEKLTNLMINVLRASGLKQMASQKCSPLPTYIHGICSMQKVYLTFFVRDVYSFVFSYNIFSDKIRSLVETGKKGG